MKDAVKLFGVLFWGLLTAVIIYPFLHESGHSVAAILAGAEILEFNLFPLPNVLCNMTNISDIGRIFIGLNGMLLPIIFSDVISLTFKKKNFWIRYVAFVLNCISILSAFVSLLAAISFCLGRTIINEDVTQILEMYSNSIAFISIFVIAITVYLIVRLKLDKPIEKCLAYFGLTKTKSGTA